MRKSVVISVWAASSAALLCPLRGLAQDYAVRSVDDGGSIAGSVTFSDGAPERTEVKVTKDVEVCGQTPRYASDLVVNSSNNGLRNVVVSLKDISSGKDWDVAAAEMVLDQQDCWFDPHVLVVPAGRSFNVLNNDGILHNVHTRGEENRPINRAQPGFLTTLELELPFADFVHVKCDIHEWMEGWIVVSDHPYIAVTDENGSFQIGNVPPGTYALEFWHETLGSQIQNIDVTGGGTTRADVTFAARE